MLFPLLSFPSPIISFLFLCPVYCTLHSGIYSVRLFGKYPGVYFGGFRKAGKHHGIYFEPFRKAGKSPGIHFGGFREVGNLQSKCFACFRMFGKVFSNNRRVKRRTIPLQKGLRGMWKRRTY